MAAGAVIWVAAVVLFILGGLITLWGNWCRGWSIFWLGALLAYTFGASAIQPRLFDELHDPTVKGATDALGALTVLFFAGTGGALALLWTEAALGLAFGFSAIVAVLLLLGGTVFMHTWVSELLLLCLLALGTVFGWRYVRKDKPSATVVVTSLMGALLMVCAVDRAVGWTGTQGQLISDLTALTTGDWEGIGRCGAEGAGSCHGWMVFVVWLGLAASGVVVQCRYTSAAVFHLKQQVNAALSGDQPYQEVPGGPSEAKTPKATVRRVRGRGDSTGRQLVARATNLVNLRVAREGEEEVEGGQRQSPEEKVIDMLADMCTELSIVFGFQEHSAYNQVEHLVILLGNQRRYQEPAYKRLAPPGGVAEALAEAELNPVEILHQKLFQNYKKWAQHLKVPAQFDTHPSAGAAARPMPGAAPLQAWYETAAGKHKLHDCLLWMLVWGEAANLRHMPECLAWLYHKMAEHFKNSVGTELAQRQSGDFLVHTVTPIYKVVAAGAKGKDHPERRNYDDFNEFFWTRDCLQYAWTPPDEEQPGVVVDPESGLPSVAVVSPGGAPSGSGSGSGVVMVADAMQKGPKTFIEKRSWLAIALAFRRIIDFHVLTFHLLAVWSFWGLLCWDYPYGLQLMSSVFLAMNFLGITWCGLEIWQTAQDDAVNIPEFHVKPEAKLGFALRLLTRFAFLYQQIHFYGMSLQHDGMDLTPGVDMADKAMQTRAWWQYVWLSLILLGVWAVDCLLQLWPSLSSRLFEAQNARLRVLLEIVFPQTGNYTGKHVHERESRVLVYMGFWAVVLSFKFWFSYYFEVRPLALPALELSDDLINIPGGSTAKTVMLIVARWAPFIAIYMLDTIIWYSVAAGLVGVLIGLDEKLGQVLDFAGIRSHFMRVPESFTSRLLFRHDDQRPSCRRKESTLTELKMPRKYTSSRNDLRELLGGAAEESQPLVPAASSSASASASAPPPGRPQLAYRSMSSGGDFLDVATSKWKDFAHVWNAVVRNLRETDVISNDEKAMLSFHHFDKLGVSLSKPIYLPVFQTAGYVEQAERLCSEKGNQYREEFKKGQNAEHQAKMREAEASLWQMLKNDVSMQEAVSEAVELGLFLVEHLLGDKHAADVAKIKENLETLLEGATGGDEEQGAGAAGRSVLHFIQLEEVEKVRKPLGELVAVLKGALVKRVPNPNRVRPTAQTEVAVHQGGMIKVGSTMKKSRSAGFLVGALSSPDFSAEGAGMNGTPEIELDSLRSKTSKLMGELLRGFKSIIVANAGQHAQFTSIRKSLANILEQDEEATRTSAGPDEAKYGNSNFVRHPYYASQQLDKLVPDARRVYEPVLAKLHGLLNVHVAEAVPRSMEARRRLTFFVNSLFMDLPKAPSIAHMMSWTVLTPFYGEEVLYSRKELETANKDGINQLLYLKTLYPTDWANFRERLGFKDEGELWARPKYWEELRLWASLRAQTLSRTVQGMMYYEDALRVLGTLDRGAGGQQGVEELEEHIKRKFSYVVSCQIYGKQKQEQNSKADDIELLLRRYPNLRVAYIDEVQGQTDGSEVDFYSVLVRGGPNGKGVEELYRVQLPGNPVLGEGKPENQNHAVIFSRGEHLMAIDMNQEGYFEDAFKMRNFLQEFAASDPDVPTTILGFREHIFTGGVSSLANYMALQEFSFVTLGQRVLNRPLRMRLHYGHPDVFDKLFFMQNGGVSKASKSINLSEDIFAGYNNVLRGGNVEFKEYVQVGKGRDVGMQQIYKFEAKLSEGAAEQSLSRDLNRMLARLDFCRLLSFYFGGIGHYLSSVLTVAAIWGLVYLMLGLALFSLEKIGDRPIVPEGALQFALAGVGVLQTVPLFCTLLLEKGFVGACLEVLQVFISGGPLYFIFHIRTRDYYYTHTVLSGGSGYKATGRGFVINHSPFDENFRFFASSHLYLGFEVAAALILLAFYSDAGQYAGRTWSLWFAAVAFLFAPFWFNPMTFEWDRVMEDYARWLAWTGSSGGAVTNSWESWWKDETSHVKDLSMPSRAYLIARSLIWALIGAGLLYGPLCTGADVATARSVGMTVLWSCAKLLGLFALKLGVETCIPKLRTWRDRHMFMTLFYFLVALCALDVVLSMFVKDLSAFVFVLAGYYILSCVNTVLFMIYSPLINTHVVKRAHWLHDQLLAHAIFAVLWVLALLQVVNKMQTFVLYRNSLSKGVVVAELIRNAAQASQSQSKQQPAGAAGEAGAGAAAGASASAGGAGGAGRGAASRIQPEERVVELETTGSGGSSKKKNGRAGAAAQQAQGEAPPRPQQVVESFEFRQPTDFPKRS